MDRSSNNRKLLIFTSIFLLIISSFVMASFTLSSSDTSFTGEPMENKSGAINIENSYLMHHISDLTYTFIPNSALSSSSLNVESLKLNSEPTELANMSGPTSVSFEFEVPRGLDAIDENFDEVSWTAGTLEIEGYAENISNSTINETFLETLDFTVKIENSLEFYNNQIEFESSDEDPRNTSSGKTRTVRDGDNVKILIFYENIFTEEDIIFYMKDIEFVLYVDGEELDRQGGKDNVDSEEVGEAEVEFDVEDLDTGESYDVEIEMVGFTDYGDEGGRHGEIFEFEIDVEEAVEESTFVGDSDGDGVNDDLDLCPNTNILCISDEAGCEMDPDNDGICNGVDRTPNGEVKEEQQITQNTISKQEDDVEEPEEVEEKVVKKDNESSGTGSFFFGLIVGFIGAALFFTLTKV